MPALDAQFRDVAHRMLRKTWSDENDTQRLAEELYDIFKGFAATTTGTVQFDTGDTVFVAAPLDSLDLPFLDFDATTRKQALGELNGRQPNETQSERYRYFTRRTMLLGAIVSQQPSGTYTVNIYPNDFTDTPVQYTQVREVQGRTIAVGTRVLVNRLDVIEAAELRLDDGNIEGTRIKLIRREHYFSCYSTAVSVTTWLPGNDLAESHNADDRPDDGEDTSIPVNLGA